MKFSISKDKLLEGLSTVQNVVSTRTTLPILSNVLLQASDGEIRLTTTDLDVGIRGSVEAQVERTGATTLPARRLFSIVREFVLRDLLRCRHQEFCLDPERFQLFQDSGIARRRVSVSGAF